MKRSDEAWFSPGGSSGSPIPPTISPRIDCEKYSPVPSMETSGPRNGFGGSLGPFRCRWGRWGTPPPPIRLHPTDAPAAHLDPGHARERLHLRAAPPRAVGVSPEERPGEHHAVVR